MLRGSKDSFLFKHFSQENQDQCFQKQLNISFGQNVSWFLIFSFSHQKRIGLRTNIHNAYSPSPLSTVYLFHILTGISWHDQGNVKNWSEEISLWGVERLLKVPHYVMLFQLMFFQPDLGHILCTCSIENKSPQFPIYCFVLPWDKYDHHFGKLRIIKKERE